MMDAFVVNYTTKSNRRKNLLVLADTVEQAKSLAENYLNGEKIRSITYVVPEKNSSV